MLFNTKTVWFCQCVLCSNICVSFLSCFDKLHQIISASHSTPALFNIDYFNTHKLWVLNHSSIDSPCVLWHSTQQSINQSVPHIAHQTCVTMTVFCSIKMHFSTSKTHGMCHEWILIVNKQWAMFVVFTNAQPTTVTQNMIQSNCKKLCTTCNVCFLAFYSPPSVSPTHFFRSLLQILAQRAALTRQGIIPDTHLLCPGFGGKNKTATIWNKQTMCVWK